MKEDKIIEERKEKIVSFLKKNYLYISIVFLILIIILSIYIRTNNIQDLKDITTGGYTLGPDLDPFLYLRNAQQILNGTLTNPDLFVRAPIGASPYAAGNLMPWVLVLFYKIGNIFSDISIEYVALITPVILFSLTLICFFLFVQKSFSFMMSRELSFFGAIIASFLYASVPQMLHRTTAGIPEIESLGMLFFWLAFYFFFSAWTAKKINISLIHALLAGLSTSLMIWSWGGFRYIFLTFTLSLLLIFIFQKLERRQITVFAIWWVISLFALYLKPESTLQGMFSSIPDVLFSTSVLFLVTLDFILHDYILNRRNIKINLDRKIVSIILSVILFSIISSILFGPGFIFSKVGSTINYLVAPFGDARISLTVAENRSPYFSEIYNAFSTQISFFSKSFSLSLFWFFFLGTCLLFYNSVNEFDKKNKLILNISFILFLFGFIFSKYSSGGLFNGSNFISKLVYFGSLLLIGGVLGYVKYKENKNFESKFNKILFSNILLLSFIFFAIISMRGAVRLLFIISPPVIIGTSYLIAKLFEKSLRTIGKKNSKLYLGIFLISLLLTGLITYGYSVTSYNQTKYNVPGPYQQQWQKAMSWVRDSTPTGSIFVHWWDYGYWVQTIGQRPTVTDGAHLNEFWDHTTARYLMTAENEQTTLNLAKAHNISYVLFDSTDIGKYSAFSSIGSDSSGKDRLSYMPIFNQDSTQTQEFKDQTILVYIGGFSLDKDLLWENEFFPSEKSGIPGFFVTVEKGEIKKVSAIVVYGNKRAEVPIKHIYKNGELYQLSNEGLNAIFYLIPRVLDSQLQPDGSALFLSEKVANGQFARMYLLGETNFSLVHEESSLYVEYISQITGIKLSFVNINGNIQGPIKIFKVPDLTDVQYHPEYLEIKGLGKDEFAELDYLGK